MNFCAAFTYLVVLGISQECSHFELFWALVANLLPDDLRVVPKRRLPLPLKRL